MGIKKNIFAPWASGLGATRRAAMLLLVMLLTTATAWATDKTLSGSESYTALNGDVLTGSTSGTVTIASGANVTLSDVTITGGIVCAGTAEITLVGTNSVTGFNGYDPNIDAVRYTAGIQVGGSGTTLTIKGNGSLTANGALHSAGIGLSRAWDVDATGGHILIEGGNITATGNGKGAGIGTGACLGDTSDKTATLGNITIKGGTVRAIGGTDNDYPGNGIGKGGAYSYGHAVVGTITIYDGIDMVDASSISESVTYMHVDNETETNVTASASTYFTIIEDGNRRIIVQKVTPTIADVPDQTYTGSEIKPEPLVLAGSLSLTKGTDYVYSYTNNTNAGTATVRATFQGDYASLGYVEKEFTILPSTVIVNVTGNGTVTYNDKSAASGETFGVAADKGTDVTLTLAPESGYAVSIAYGYTNNSGTTASGLKLPISGTTATLTVPDNLKDGTYVNLTVTFVSALVGGADEVSAVALTDNTVTNLAGGWYKVDSNITFGHTLNLLGDTHLIIADGKTMTVNTATDRGIDSDYTLTVSGAGALNVTTTSSGVAVRVGNYVQTGATVTASGYIGIRCKDNFDEFNVTNDFTFSGGQLTATGSGGDGIWADNDITLSCTNATDFIQSSSYNGTIKVADGKALTDGTNIYSGTLTDEQITAIANKTLTKSSWTELKMALEAGGTRTVTLTNNVMRINSDCIEPSGTVTLDLNGYTIDGGTTQTNPLFRIGDGVSLTITDSQTGGNLCNAGRNATVSVNEGGSLTLAGGTINAQASGVFMWGGNFNMTGGTITGGSSNGVYLNEDNVSFTMTGGTITCNEVGVEVNSANATFIVSGNVNITGNTMKDVNLKYSGSNFNPIMIGGKLASTARIGVYTDLTDTNIEANQTLVFTDGLKDKGTRENFVRNNEGSSSLFLANLESGEMAFSRPFMLHVPDNVTVNELTTQTPPNYNVGCGDVVTLLYGADNVSSGCSLRYIVPNGAITYLGAVDAQGKCAEFTMPGSDMTITRAADNNYSFGGITLKETFINGNSQGLDATFDGSSQVTIDIPENIAVNSVDYNRTFTTGKCATVMLPFSMDVSNISGTNFYTFGGVTKTADKWIATMNEVTGSLTANTPYLFVPAGTSLTFTGGATLNTTGGGNCLASDTEGWEFHGTYSNNVWDEAVTHDYGFAATSGTSVDGKDVEAGQFVRLTTGASAKPMRCYLSYVGVPAQARALPRGAAATDEELPSSIIVRLVGANGQTTAIGTIDTKTGEVTFDSEAWYTLDGVRLSGKPTKKGLYINNGKKIVIK